jgi:hypothetical protein
MITSLTPEQEALLPVYRDDWIKIGLDITAINKEAAVDAVKLAYRLAEQPEPKHFLFADGPVEAMRYITHAADITLTAADFDRLTATGTMALTDAVRDIIKTLPDTKPGLHWPAFYAQHDAGWLGFHQFFADQFGLSEQSAGLRELGRQAGWVWMYGDLAIISAKPIFVSMDRQGRLHNERRAAVEYADGTKVYAVNGVRIPGKWVLERTTIDPSEILQCEDVDQRAAGIALVGYAHLKDRLDYKILEGDPSTDIGALIELKIPGLSNPGRFLEAVCPRNGPVFLGVPPVSPWDNEPIVDAVGAQAFLARLPRSAYAHPPIRT